LAAAGFLVHQASDGQGALEFIDRNGDPDVILLDFRMPGDGRRPVSSRRTRASRSRVIMLTGGRIGPRGGGFAARRESCWRSQSTSSSSRRR